MAHQFATKRSLFLVNCSLAAPVQSRENDLMIQLDNLSLRRGARELLSDAGLRLHAGERGGGYRAQWLW